MLLTTVKSILNTKLKNDIKLLDDTSLANSVYEALFYVAQNSEPSVLIEADDSDAAMLRKLPDGGFIRIPTFPDFQSASSLDIDEVLAFAVIYKALSFISHDASQIAEYDMRAKQLIGFYNTSSNEDIPNAVILHEAFVSMASLRDSLDDISDIASNLTELLSIDMSIINSVFADVENWKTLNVATGVEGTEVAYDASTNTLTVPRGNTGAQGIQGIQGIQGVKGDTGDALTVTSITNNPDYTLTLNFSDGTSHTTGVMRGLQGEQGIQGIQGVQGEQGIQGEKGDSVTNVTSSKVGKTTTVTVEVENNAPFTFDVEDGEVSQAYLDTALALKQDKVTNVSDTEISYLDGATSNIQTQLNTKANSSHNHDGIYEPANLDIVKAPDGVLPPLDGSNLTGIAGGTTTTTPTISITSSMNEGSSTVGTITNYDALADYWISADIGTVTYTSGSTFVYQSPFVGATTTATISVYATKAGELKSNTATKSITVVFVPSVDDDLIQVTDFTSGFELNDGWETI